MKIILCSNNNIKKDIITKWFKEKNIEIELNKVDIENDSIPPQPIGEDIKLICLKKINDVKVNYKDFDYIISTENFLDILEDKIKYKLCMCVYKYDSNEYLTKISEGIDLDLNILDNFSNFILIIKDLKNSYINSKNKYMFCGCEEKLCDLVNKYYPEIPRNNFIKSLIDNKYDKFHQFSKLLDELFFI